MSLPIADPIFPQRCSADGLPLSSVCQNRRVLRHRRAVLPPRTKNTRTLDEYVCMQIAVLRQRSESRTHRKCESAGLYLVVHVSRVRHAQLGEAAGGELPNRAGEIVVLIV